MFNKKLLSSIDLGKYKKKNPYKKDMILDPMGQWKHPGKNTRIPSDRITMKGVNYPVLGVSNTGQKQMMQPGREYDFPGADYVDEYPQMKKGGLPKAQKGVATYQDSLDVYNNALKLKAFYDSKKQFYNISTRPWYNTSNLKREEKETYNYPVDSRWTPEQKRNFQKTKDLIKANKDSNIAYITDMITGALDPDAPALRYDNRIKPQSQITYKPQEAKFLGKEKSLYDALVKKYEELNITAYGDPRFSTLAPSKKAVIDYAKKLGYSQKDAETILYKLKKQSISNANTPGIFTDLPYYDPLAIKPGRLLTDDEIKKRVKKYGTTGIPQDRLDKLGLKSSNPPKNSNPPKKSTSSTVTKSPCSNPITTVINNIPEKIPFGKKLVGTDEETLPVTGKKCEYVKTINPIYENITIDPIKPPAFPLRIESGNLPPLQSSSFDLPETIEAPQYVLDPYTANRLSLDVKLPQNKIARLFDRGVIDSKGHIELGKKNKTRLIPRIVQKVTGYDPAYFEGYEDEEGNFVHGELDYGNATGSEIEFRGAASLRDYMNQQKYKKEYEEYDKKLDEWFEKYEQSKKKQEEGRAFKKGGAKKKYTSDIINSTNYLFAEHPLFKKKKQSKKRIYNPNAKYYADGGENLQEKCPPYQYWNGETCVPVSRELAPLDPQYLSENPDVATNMQIEPEVSVSPLGSDFSKAKSWIDKWHDSPMHDKMLMKSLKLSNYHALENHAIQEKLFKEYKDKRKKNIQTIPALNIDFNKTSPDVKAYEDKYGINLWAMSHGNTGAVSIFNSHPGNKQTLIHEISHSSDRPDDKLGRLIPYNDQLTMQYRTPLNWKYSQYGKDMMKEYKEKGWRLDEEYMGEEEIPRDIYEQQQFDDWNKYLSSGQGTEVRARLNEIRQGAQEKNIYDPFNKKITGRQFKNLKNLNYPKPLNDLRKTFSDKDIRWMLNNISKNNNETEDAIQYGKKGGALPEGKYGHSVGNLIRKQDGGEPKDYQAFLEYSKTAPENRQPSENYYYMSPDEYDHYGMWEALGKPKNFEEALQMNPDWQQDEEGYYHGYSVNPYTGIFLKSGAPGLKEGDTKWMEIAGHYLSPRANESTPVFDIDLQRFKYIPKEEDGGTIELELTPEEIEEYRKGGYIVEDISVPSLTRMQTGGFTELATQLLKQVTPGNKVRRLIYSGINPAGYGLKKKALNFPKELSLTKTANETRPFRVGLSLQNPGNLTKFLEKKNIATSEWDALPDREKMQMLSKDTLEKIEDVGKRRLDAFAVGLKQPQEYDTLEQVGDNIFRMKGIGYDPEYFSELYTDILAKNMLDKNSLYSGENPLVTIAKQHYDRGQHPYLMQLLKMENPDELTKDMILRMSKLNRSQIDNALGYRDLDFAPWQQKRIVELSKINKDPMFKHSIYDTDHFGVMGSFRWDLADTPEGMIWQANDNWNLNPWENRGGTRIDEDPFLKSFLSQHYKKPLQHVEALGLVGGKPFDIQNNFLIQPGTFKTIKQYQDGGEYQLGDEVDEATMKQLKKLGFTFEQI